MRILAIDVGTGTQDILLFNSAQPIENALQLIMPSPTQIAAGQIRRATEAGRGVAISGTIAGGGPSHWALEDHLRANLPAYATHDAAMTFDDDLDAVQRMGVTLVSGDEIARLDADQVTLRDLDLNAIRTALAAFDVSGEFDGLALGCLDHGAAPPGYSDRLFRFEHLRRVVEARNDLRAFACLPGEVPDYLTRARSLLASVDVDAPVVFLDTGPAAALGALQDPGVGEREEQVVLNLGNMHALCFHLRSTQIVSLYEHHTGEVTAAQLEDFTERLIAGSLPHEDVFGSKGHGVYYVASRNRGPRTQNLTAHPDPPRRIEGRAVPETEPAEVTPLPFIAVTGPQRGTAHPEPVEGRSPPSTEPVEVASLPLIAVTGPQRGKLRGSALAPYFAVPHGDMMVSGCFGLLWAFAEKRPEFAAEILPALGLPRSS